MFKLLRLGQYLSLDTCFGTFGGAFLAINLTHSSPPFLWIILLPVATWVVYTLDHLIDSHRMGPSAHTERHLFHDRHNYILSFIIALVVLTSGYLCCQQEAWNLLKFGAVMGTLSGIYFFLIHCPKLSGLKEVGVACVYTVGIWGLPLWLSSCEPRSIVGMALFFLVGYLNLLGYSIYDFEVDLLDHSPSLVTTIGICSFNRWVIGVACAFVLIWIGWISLDGGCRSAQIVLMSMFVGTLLIFFCRKKWAHYDLYKVWGESIFYWPLILYWFKG